MIKRQHQLPRRLTFLHHDIRLLENRRCNPQSLPLTQRIKMQSPVLPQPPAICRHHRPRRIRHEGTQKIAHLHLTDKTNPLTILLPRRCQPQRRRPLPHLRLQHPANRKQRPLHLMLLQQRQKIGLILIRIPPPPHSVRPALLMRHLRIMPSRHGTESFLQRIFQKHPELDLPIAHHVRIRRDPRLIAMQQITHHPLPVIRH